MRIITTPDIKNGGFEPSYKIYCKYTLFYDSIKYTKPDFIKGVHVPHSDFIPTFKKTENKKKSRKDKSKSRGKDKKPKEKKEKKDKKKKKDKKGKDESENEEEHKTNFVPT